MAEEDFYEERGGEALVYARSDWQKESIAISVDQEKRHQPLGLSKTDA